MQQLTRVTFAKQKDCELFTSATHAVALIRKVQAKNLKVTRETIFLQRTPELNCNKSLKLSSNSSTRRDRSNLIADIILITHKRLDTE